MLNKEQLQTLAAGEAGQMFGLQRERELHVRLSQAGVLGEIAWQLRLAAKEKWDRGYCLRRTELEQQLKRDDCGLNWGWDEVWQRFDEKSARRASEPTTVLVIDLPVGQVVLNDDLHTGRRPPEYDGQVGGHELTDLRIAAFVELVLQHRTPEEVCYAIACLINANDDLRDVAEGSTPGMFDELIDAEIAAGDKAEPPPGGER
jgi:hypothetical protein